jgi:hypothetical protein
MKVGIHENIVLQKAALNEKGTMAFVFRPKKLEGEKTGDSFFQEEQSAEVTSDGNNGAVILFFCPKMPTFKKKDGDALSNEEILEFVQKDLNTVSNVYSHILAQYMSLKDIKFRPYDGTGVTAQNWKTALLDNDNIAAVYKNYSEQFANFIAPYADKDEHTMRLKLVRQSKDKHYATIPTRYLDTQPFLEPMTIPADRSQVKFTKYEIDKGLNSGEPVGQGETADAIPEVTPEASENVFGAR